MKKEKPMIYGTSQELDIIPFYLESGKIAGVCIQARQNLKEKIYCPVCKSDQSIFSIGECEYICQECDSRFILKIKVRGSD